MNDIHGDEHLVWGCDCLTINCDCIEQSEILSQNMIELDMADESFNYN